MYRDLPAMPTVCRYQQVLDGKAGLEGRDFYTCNLAEEVAANSRRALLSDEATAHPTTLLNNPQPTTNTITNPLERTYSLLQLLFVFFFLPYSSGVGGGRMRRGTAMTECLTKGIRQKAFNKRSPTLRRSATIIKSSKMTRNSTMTVLTSSSPRILPKLSYFS